MFFSVFSTKLFIAVAVFCTLLLLFFSAERMACGLALKRPHDYDDYLAAEGAEVKRARHTQAHCSPFRAQIGTLAASLPSTPIHQLKDCGISSFARVGNRSQLTAGQLTSYLRAEIRFLKRCHMIPRRIYSGSGLVNANKKLIDSQSNTTETTENYRETPSPNANSGSESDSDGGGNQKSSALSKQVCQDIYEKPQFSFKQVRLICDRLLKQQEEKLRCEYETILNQRLEEQHEQYVQFAREQLERQDQNSGVELTYLS